MRAVIYARYSTDLQSDASIEDQVRVCRERIAAEGGTVGQVYSDHALSGASMMRPGLQALMQEGAAGRFDVVYAEALDRLSRDQEDIAAIYKRLSFAGVRIVTLTEGEIGQLHIGVMGMMNAKYLSDLADKTRRGLRGRIEAGRSGGGNSFGYDVVRKIGANGEADAGERAINPTEATVVRRVFEDYANGLSPRAIAKALNAEGVPGPSGKGWGASTVHGNPKRGTGILNNELYVGRLVWNRLRYVKDPETGKRVSRANPESDWVIHDVPELRIIDQDLWDRVKARQDEAKRPTRPDHGGTGFWTAKRPRHLLSGLMTCGVCGGGVIQVGKDYLGCANHRNKGTCDHRKLVRRHRLEEVVLVGLKERLLTPELTEEFCREYVRATNRLCAEKENHSDRARKDLARVEKEIAGIIAAIKAGAFTPSLTEELQRLEVEKERLEQDVEAETATVAPVRMHPGLADVYADKVGRLAESLNAPESKAEAVAILRGLIDGIVLSPAEEGKATEVRLRGDLATLLGFAASEGCSLTLVAGAGFEPATFRL